MTFEVIPTPQFAKELKEIAKKYPAIKHDIKQLSNSLSENPKQGEPLGLDCYKVRMQITGKKGGKSGGARIITCVKVVDQNVYLISIYDKSDKSTLEKRFIKTYLDQLFKKK
jgi:mRNA-degrading endonuclease RelE of RelBE toxin-antitoxin system